MRFRSLVTVLTLAAVALFAVGCPTAPGGGTASTQPLTTQLDPQAVVFGVNLILSDYQVLVASGVVKGDPTVDAALAATQKALTDLQTADPSTPAYQTYVKAANDAALTLATSLAKAKTGK